MSRITRFNYRSVINNDWRSSSIELPVNETSKQRCKKGIACHFPVLNCSPECFLWIIAWQLLPPGKRTNGSTERSGALKEAHGRLQCMRGYVLNCIFHLRRTSVYLESSRMKWHREYPRVDGRDYSPFVFREINAQRLALDNAKNACELIASGLARQRFRQRRFKLIISFAERMLRKQMHDKLRAKADWNYSPHEVD